MPQVTAVNVFRDLMSTLIANERSSKCVAHLPRRLEITGCIQRTPTPAGETSTRDREELGTSRNSQPTCTPNRELRYPDQPECHSQPAPKCSDTKLLPCEK